MHELLIYPLVINNKNSITHVKDYEKIIKKINKINFDLYGVKLLEVKRYKQEDLIYAKIEYNDSGDYDPLMETEVKFIKALNDNDIYNIKFIGFKEKFKSGWEKFFY